MKTFVTGATGFLGSHLVDLLLQEGHEVVCLVRKTSDLKWLKEKKVQLVEGQLFPNDPGLKKGLEKADWCFHVAGLISTHKPQEYYQVNAGGTRHCLDTCLQIAPRLKRFVLVSSIAACGPSLNGERVHEKTAPHPVTEYGHSKLEAERITLSYQSKIPISILRPPGIYGPRDTMIFPVFKMAKRHLFLTPAGKPRLVSMVYVEDVARACLWAAQSEQARGEVFFISDGDAYYWEDVADALASVFRHQVFAIPLPKSLLMPAAFLEEVRGKLFQKTPRINRNHIRQFFKSWGISTDKIQKAGFSPRFTLEEGMKASVAGYRQLGWI